jgi:membrane protein YqaA with SNARE-associated domain
MLQHSRHKHLMPPWLLHFGLAGIFVVAATDASIIPLPIPGTSDLLILLLSARRENPLLVALVGITGSLLGGVFTWGAGKKGGEPMLRRYASERLVKRIKGWVTRKGMLTVGVACLLPPPVPLMPFLLAAGALGVSRRRYMIALGVARTIRYGLLAWLGATYGRIVIRLWARYLAGWADVILWIFIALLIAAVSFGIWKYRHDQHKYGKGAAAKATT